MNRWIIVIKMKVISHSYDVTNQARYLPSYNSYTASTAAMPRIQIDLLDESCPIVQLLPEPLSLSISEDQLNYGQPIPIDSQAFSQNDHPYYPTHNTQRNNNFYSTFSIQEHPNLNAYPPIQLPPMAGNNQQSSEMENSNQGAQQITIAQFHRKYLLPFLQRYHNSAATFPIKIKWQTIKKSKKGILVAYHDIQQKIEQTMNTHSRKRYFRELRTQILSHIQNLPQELRFLTSEWEKIGDLTAYMAQEINISTDGMYSKYYKHPNSGKRHCQANRIAHRNNVRRSGL